jgi:hypothetical protein
MPSQECHDWRPLVFARYPFMYIIGASLQSTNLQFRTL